MCGKRIDLRVRERDDCFGRERCGREDFATRGEQVYWKERGKWMERQVTVRE